MSKNVTPRSFNYTGTVNGSGTTGPLPLLDPPIASQPVPTLSEWAQYMLALLLVGITGWRLRGTAGRR